MSRNVNTVGKTIEVPGHDHPITIEYNPSHVWSRLQAGSLPIRATH
jgi:hypothetical protein